MSCASQRALTFRACWIQTVSKNWKKKYPVIDWNEGELHVSPGPQTKVQTT